MSGDWVLFKVDGKNCIGLYLKSVGYICQIDSCQLLGDGRYGWPCHCRKDADPGYCVMLICEDERPSCKDIKFMARNDIVCKFNHPVLTIQNPCTCFADIVNLQWVRVGDSCNSL